MKVGAGKTAPAQTERCPWCGSDPLYVAYHDREWGVPCRDESKLFEFLVLEGMQAGLSWLTILKKREHLRHVFDGFAAEKIARYGAADVARLLADPGIVRNRAKIEAAIANARATLALHEAGGSLAELLWRAVDGRPHINRWRTPEEVPVFTPAAESLAQELKRRGFRFVGPTIVYSLMQATGLVNDHLVGCFRHAELMDPNWTAGRR
ncbi:MAG: DNA-3-methyladenine glycosylase I [Rhodocyclaceae bacterium]|nr:DNA-3-methyladenine glycosylase I [Rhodocyclaceae bacterium]